MNIESTWISVKRPLQDVLISAEESEDAEIEDLMTIENVVMLNAPEAAPDIHPACMLTLSCEPPNQIARISVLCEARVIEVYGHHGEYLKTVKNSYMDEGDDMLIFKGDVLLDWPVSLCTIKFLTLRHPNEMYLFGVKVHLVQERLRVQDQRENLFSTVDQRLSEIGLGLSDKAEAFKQLVQSCQKMPMINQNIIDEQFSHIINAFPKTMGRLDSQNNLKEDSLKSEMPVKNGSSDVSPCLPSSSRSNSTVESISNSTQTEEDYTNLETKLKTLILEQFEEMDRKMSEKINKRFQECEVKLLCKLDEIESYIKPHGLAS